MSKKVEKLKEIRGAKKMNMREENESYSEIEEEWSECNGKESE